MGAEPILTYQEAGLDEEWLKKLEERQEWVAEKEAAESAVKHLNGVLGEAIAQTGNKTVTTEKWRVTVTEGASVTIDKKKLLELGVGAEIIEAATKRKTYQTLTVTGIKQKEE